MLGSIRQSLSSQWLCTFFGFVSLFPGSSRTHPLSRKSNAFTFKRCWLLSFWPCYPLLSTRNSKKKSLWKCATSILPTLASKYWPMTCTSVFAWVDPGGHVIAMAVFGYGGYWAYRWDIRAAELLALKREEIRQRRGQVAMTADE